MTHSPSPELVDALYARVDIYQQSIRGGDVHQILRGEEMLSGPLALKKLRGEASTYPEKVQMRALALIGMVIQMEAAGSREQERQAQRSGLAPIQPLNEADRCVWGLRTIVLEETWDEHALAVSRMRSDTDVTRVLSTTAGLLTGLQHTTPALEDLRDRTYHWMKRILSTRTSRADRDQLLDLTVCEAISILKPGTSLRDIEGMTGPLSERDRSHLPDFLQKSEVKRWLTDPAQIIPETSRLPLERIKTAQKLLRMISDKALKLKVLQFTATGLGFGAAEPVQDEDIPFLNGDAWQWKGVTDNHAAAIRKATTEAMTLIHTAGKEGIPEFTGLMMAILHAGGHPSAARTVESIYLEPPGSVKGEEQRTHFPAKRDAGRDWHLHLALQAWLPLVEPGVPLITPGRTARDTKQILAAPQTTGLVLASRIMKSIWSELNSNGSQLASLDQWPELLQQTALAEESLGALRPQPEWAPDESAGAAPRLNSRITGLRELLSHQTRQGRGGAT